MSQEPTFVDGKRYYEHFWSALLWDGGILLLPLPVITQMKLTEAYALPPIGSTSSKAVVDVHDDTIELTAVLAGPERYALKLILETMAEASKRGSGLGSYSPFSGLALVTSMTIRTDLQVKSLVFTASAAKRNALDVVITLSYMPPPGSFGKLLDMLSVGVGALADHFGQ